MTNYINTITLEDGGTYPIGPYYIDDYGNTVQRGVTLQSNLQNNVVLAGSLEYHDIHNPNSSATNMIVITTDSSPVNADKFSTGNIRIGNSDFKIGIDYNKGYITNGITLTSVRYSGSTIGHATVGGFSTTYSLFDAIAGSVPLSVTPNIALYAVGKITNNDGYYEIGNYTYLHYYLQGGTLLWSLDGTTINDWTTDIPIVDGPTIGFKLTDSVDENNSHIFTVYMGVVSDVATTDAFTNTPTITRSPLPGTYSVTLYTNAYRPYSI